MSHFSYRAKWVAQIAGTFYSAVKSLSMKEQVYGYLELVLDVLSFCVFKTEVMYMYMFILCICYYVHILMYFV
jgi:hypothetical protein